VEECDLTRLEGLRKHLNDRRPASAPPLTFLPFIVAALARVLDKFPQCNALYDSARGVLVKHKGVHVGIATQTPQGLKVPVVRNAESRALHDLAAEIRRVAEAARTNKSPREELTGSTITVTSLGKLGGIASTPRSTCPRCPSSHQQGGRNVPWSGWTDHGAADDESLLVLRSSFRRWLRRGLDDPGSQRLVRATSDDFHRRLKAHVVAPPPAAAGNPRLRLHAGRDQRPAHRAAGARAGDARR
jgi:hypothetical protein